MLVIDTSVLLRWINAQDQQRSTVREMFVELRRGGESFVSFPQNVAEFWAVATRPIENNGYGLSTHEADRRIALLERLGDVLPEHDDSYNTWKTLVRQYDVKGKPTHDARIVAQMKAHGLNTIVTFNVRDFRRFEDLTVLTPQEALSR